MTETMTQRPTPTTREAAIVHETLWRSERAWTAAELAARIGVGGSRETQRRHIREIIRRLRQQGCRIVATLQDGYAYTEDAEIWKDYVEGRKIDAKRILAEAGKRTRELRSQGQGQLFR